MKKYRILIIYLIENNRSPMLQKEEPYFLGPLYLTNDSKLVSTVI